MAGGFKLRKWIANYPEILANIPRQDQELSSSFTVDSDLTRYTLGLRWNQLSDNFSFAAPSVSTSRAPTKRSVLSFIARQFDPLGWLAPITIVAKIFMQELWAIRLDWDDELPDELSARWTEFTDRIDKVNSLSMPRWLNLTSSALAVELHGFSDASRKALAAVVYVRVIRDDKTAHVVMIAAKTKVTPLNRLTIPRLELYAAVLLVRQVTKIREALDYHDVPIHLWTDSTVALTWIKSHPSRWKDYVHNRVAFIQELSNSRWHHVSGKENPADIASRGTSPQSLQSDSIWWTGPSWLRTHSESWLSSPPTTTSLQAEEITSEERSLAIAVANEGREITLWDLIERYSSLNYLLRVTAWLLRARDRLRKTMKRSCSSHLTPDELKNALHFWTRLTQQAYFKSEISTLLRQNQLNPKSPLYRLTPQLDSNGLLRLRGRLQFSKLSSDAKTPLILPRTSRLTTLVIDSHHRRTLHGGPQLTLSSIRQQFWVIGGRVPIRSFIHRCMICARHRAAASQQLIGQLPAPRVTPCRPFFHTGVDYAGPLTLKTSRGRGSKLYKGYFIIFVCFSTSAVHLEVSTDYTTEGFIAAYKRFTGRRGLCSTISSDCGTNLIGADAELKKMLNASSRDWAPIANLLANDGVSWRFHPPAAPHFGGKWEAGVKAVKYHLRRIIGDACLTYEDLTTLLVEIEAILNSRPLAALSDDPSDISALTPGHFLIGSALNTVPEPCLDEIPKNRLSRFQMLRRMTEIFWKRWASEYLHQLQTSSKWHQRKDIYQRGALVLLKDERYPPSKWPLARIIDVHPGPDNLVRVVTVKTATTTLKRPIVKVCVLPNSNSDDQD